MGVKWTEEQQKVIDLKDCNILVSAAAGSGKTAVLVERIIQMLTREVDPVSVDELLVVTFTEAAAAEMKERIRLAIEKKQKECPGDQNLLLQGTLIHCAQITTIHSFCLSVIKEYFHQIDLDPGFRVGEEGEVELIKKDVLDQLLEERYKAGEERFLTFVESYGGGRDDKKIEELILKIYEYSRSNPDPKQWLLGQKSSYQISTEEELNAHPLFQYIKEDCRKYIKDGKELLQQGRFFCLQEDGPYMYKEMLDLDLEFLEAIEKADTYTDMRHLFLSPSWKALSRKKDDSVSEEKREQVKNLRNQVKDIIKSLGEDYFFQNAEGVLEDLAICLPMFEELVDLVLSFGQAFEEKKRAQNLIDFSDMEQYAMRILTTKDENGNWIPSKAAKEYSEKYKEIMIDEYQDSNFIQEAILTSVSGMQNGTYNLFMVGDVKQSIYRFRLSRPELFMEKYATYSTEEGNLRRIDLHKNFRSRREVLDSVNGLFTKLMIPALGGITYDEQAALHVGASYPEAKNCKTEVLFVLDKERETEAKAVAGEIRKLIQEGEVLDKATGQMRPVKYGDIVVLTRSLRGVSDLYLSVFQQEGIPAHAVSKEGYFDTKEVGILLDYLRLLSNLQQDIPLTAVLNSAFGNLTGEELATIKSECPDTFFFKSVFAYRQEGTNLLIKEKVERVLSRLEADRKKISYAPLHQLIREILNETGYGNYIAALPAGEQRKLNLDMLVEKAKVFESTSYKGVFHFIRYIDQLQKYELDLGGSGEEEDQKDLVRIMSMHKSKGLEFPIVFAVGMGKRFNTQDLRATAVVHQNLGIGLDAVSVTERTKTPSLLKKIVQRQERQEYLGEELRILYVAYTRAKEKLYITGNWTGKTEPVSQLPAVSEEEPLPFAVLAQAKTPWDWIEPALRKSSSELFDVFHLCAEEIEENRREEDRKEFVTWKMLEEWDVEKVYHEEMKEELETQFSYTYPFPRIADRKQKFTVSELKKKDLPEEEAQPMFETEEKSTCIPRFAKEEETGISGASRGTLYHRLMEILDFTKEYDTEQLKEDMEQLIEEKRLDPEAKQILSRKDVVQFLDSPIGKRMKLAAKEQRLFREQPFVLGVDIQEVYPEAEEQEMVLVQGIIDAYFEEEGELVVVDYKTDRLDREEAFVERYKKQLDYYGQALSQILGKPVKEKIIYSFRLKKEIKIS